MNSPNFTLEPKLMAIWNDSDVRPPANVGPWLRKCNYCSSNDPFNDWYLWDDNEFIVSHC